MDVILPERRHGRRYLTLRTAGIVGATCVVVFLLLSIWAEFRPHSGTPRNAFESRAQPVDSSPARHDAMIVEEAPIDPQRKAEPNLLDSTAQDQLRAAAMQSAASEPSSGEEEKNFEHRPSQLGHGQRITISGGREGLQIRAEPITEKVQRP